MKNCPERRDGWTIREEFVMDSKIDLKVVMDLSIFETGGWNSLRPSNQNLLEEFIDENELWLLIGISKIHSCDTVLGRHSASSVQAHEENDVTS